jgi:hypothetical protein
MSRCWWLPLAALGLCLLLACSAPAPPATPTPAPTPTPAATPVPTLDAQVTDIQYAFLSEVNDLTSDVEALSTTPCADIASETQAHPTAVSQMRGFAATLQRVAGTQAALDSDDVRSALGDLSKALTQLDAALSACGLPAQ